MTLYQDCSNEFDPFKNMATGNIPSAFDQISLLEIFIVVGFKSFYFHIKIACCHLIPVSTGYVLGVQLISGRGLDSRPRGCEFEPHRRHSVMSFNKTHNINPYLVEIVSEYDQEIPQSQPADNPVAPRERAAQPSQDTGKTN